MEPENLNNHISEINTIWTVIFNAHKPGEDAVTLAQHQVIQRYSGAIYRYLLGALRDADAADELSQEFALRFVRGDFKRADPEKGRFRDFVKTSLYHLIVDYQKRKHKQPMPLEGGSSEPAAEDSGQGHLDDDFLNRWRDGLLVRAWEALAEVQQKTGQPYHTVLRYRAEHPQTPAHEMAEQLGAQMGKQLTAAGVRQTLHRAREKFADLLLDEVSRSMQTQDTERLEQELIDLGLHAYCKTALERRAE